MSGKPLTRLQRWRREVYKPREGMTNGCRVLLLRLSDDMSAKCIVSVPRSTLAEELGVAPARVTESIAKARDLGFLSVVRRGRPGVTAVYQGTVPAPAEVRTDAPHLVRPGVPPHLVRPPGHVLVRPGVPLSEPAWYAPAGTQVVVAAESSETADLGRGSRRGSEEQIGCQWHPHVACPADCANFGQEATA